MRQTFHNALGDQVATCDATEDIHDHGLDFRLGHDQGKRLADYIGPGAAPDVEETEKILLQAKSLEALGRGSEAVDVVPPADSKGDGKRRKKS